MTFATPANPSGLSVPADQIAEIARAVPTNILLLVNEVYHEFAAFDGEPDLLDILRRERTAPWLVLRSFSKAYRLAGARVGYGLASDENTAHRVQEHAVNFATPSLGFAAPLAVWRDQESLAETLDLNQRERDALRAGSCRHWP